jgi:cytochrome c6
VSKTIRMHAVLALALSLAGALSFAQSGAAIYKAKCQGCHGATGKADTPVAKVLKIKPVTDPSVTKMTEAEMIKATENGMGKMQPFKGKISDAEIKDSVAYFRSLMKK